MLHSGLSSLNTGRLYNSNLSTAKNQEGVAQDPLTGIVMIVLIICMEICCLQSGADIAALPLDSSYRYVDESQLRPVSVAGYHLFYLKLKIVLLIFSNPKLN
jgi:hypothetical protein